MIPQAYITEWQHKAPWGANEQIEQDLILCRILTELFQNEFLREQLVFRGGTALNKLYFPSPVRYSEDLDFVQLLPGQIKPIIETVQKTINPFLKGKGTDSRKDGFRIYYGFQSENIPGIERKIKIEINTREHFNVFPIEKKKFTINSQWYSGECTIPAYNLNEMLGTKMRALYQRSKGRDLFDLDWSLRHCKTNPNEIIEAFKKYMDFQDNKVSQKEYCTNVKIKVNDPVFCQDIYNYIRPGIEYDPKIAFKNIKELIDLI
jgi:predicted nucleotidyltransferase component of viral defense system